MCSVYVMGLESSGTKWLGQLLQMTIGSSNVHHISLPRFEVGDGRYIHDPDKFGLRERAKIAICVRDVSCAVRSNVKYNGSMQEALDNASEVSDVLQAYLADPRFNCKVFSYESAMYLKDGYVLPWIADFTGVVFPSWAYKPNYEDGNKKYLLPLDEGN